MFPVTLAGPRVCWREIARGDAEPIAAVVSNPRVFDRMLDEESPTAQLIADQLPDRIGAAREPDRAKYDLVLALGRDVIGIGGVQVTAVEHRRGELGYALHPRWWGRGLATEAAGLLLGFGFGELGLHRVEATTDPDNAASRRVLDKIGMRYEGLIRHHLLVRGRWRDSLLYAALDTDRDPRDTAWPRVEAAG